MTVGARHWGLRVAGACGLTLLVFLAMWPACGGGFVWDDDKLIFENALVTSADLQSLWKIWFSSQPVDYIPLTSTMFWVEYRLFGDNPTPYHVVNLLLHALAAVALWRVLRRLSLRDDVAWWGALIFAVHPVCVTSAAWVAEGKNTLSMVLALASLAALLRARWDEETTDFSAKWYGASLVLFLLALLAKAAVVTLAPALLVLAWWSGRLSKRTIVRAAPFFALSLVLGLVTVWFQHTRSIGDVDPRPEGWLSRIAGVGWCFWFYVIKVVWPANLTMIYPRWDIPGTPLALLPLAMLLVVLTALWFTKDRYAGGRGVVAAVACYGLMVLPVLGLVKMAYFEHSLVSDHLQYFALPAAAGLMGAGIVRLATWLSEHSAKQSGSSRQWVTQGLPASVCVVLMVLSWQHSERFVSNETLWSDVIAKNPACFLARMNRGVSRSDLGLEEGAAEDFLAATKLEPGNPRARNSLGLSLGRIGRAEESIQSLRVAVELQPTNAKYLSNLGGALARSGALEEAVKVFDRSLELDGRDAQVLANRGIAMARIGRGTEAIDSLSRALELNPNLPDAWLTRGAVKLQAGDLAEAERDLRQALTLDGRSVPVLVNLAQLCLRKGETREAIVLCQTALQIAPGLPAAQSLLRQAMSQIHGP